MQIPNGSYGLISQAGNAAVFLDSEFRYVLFPVAYIIIFILGLIMNIYALLVLRCLHQDETMSEIRIYMTNLTIADLLFVCALPPWIGYYNEHGDWVYTDFTCRVTGSLFFINTYCSVLFLCAISVNRYWGVTRPLHAASSDSRCRGIIICILIWLVAASMAIPSLVSPATHSDSTVTRCFEGYQNQTDSEKKTVAATHFAIIGMFFIVFFLVVVCNLLIARALLSQSPDELEYQSGTLTLKKSTGKVYHGESSRGAKCRALQMLLAVVGVFVVCFLPHHFVQGPWTLAVLKIQQGWGKVDWAQKTRQGLNDAHQFTLLLMNLNCILDPVVYYFSSKKIRGIIMLHIERLKQIFGCSKV